MKKIASIILSFLFVAYLTMPEVNALSYDATTVAGVSKALQEAEELKSELGFSNINFKKLTFSDSIIAYDYTKDGFVYNSEFIPIKQENKLIGWVIKFSDDNNTIYQFTDAFVDVIDNYVDDETKIAFVYDSNNCYVYDGNTLHIVAQSSVCMKSRSDITDLSEIDFSGIELGNYANTYTLQYSANNINSRAQAYIYCNVSFVSQNPPSNICWAASAACIVNYLRGYSLTAETVARYRFGENYDQLLSSYYLDDVLNSYGLSYSFFLQVPSDSVMYSNIYNGYPIMARFVSSYGGHAVVVYGINITGGYIVLMDPEYGSARANYSLANGYTYVSASAGSTLSLNSAACMSWSSGD